jgi:hypothetical protein
MATKERLHRLVDELSDEDVAAAERALEGLRNAPDPVARTLTEAPEDDEPYTEEERRLVGEAWEDVKKGHVVSSEELDREFGW